MNHDIAQLNPKIIWKNFLAITKIPRPSGHEEKTHAFLKEFAKRLHLECKEDQVGNILIKKPATTGMEDRKTVTFQCHMDMVPQKNKESTHDFVNDPIEAYIDGDWVTAKGTTLGADNGMGIAAILAVLESDDIVHGPIEALLTSDEEVGMTGAGGLSSDFISGDILLNLDTEEEGEVYIGCAGGANTDIVFPYQTVPVEKDHEAFQINITGLLGGHSGADIHLKRGNAIKILVWILNNLLDSVDCQLASIDGGSVQRNAIPREIHGVITAAKDDHSLFMKAFNELAQNMKDLFKKSDAGLSITINETELPKKVMRQEDYMKLFHAIGITPDGMLKMSQSIPDLVETSSNIAYIKTETNQVIIYSSQRSSIEAEKEEVLDNVEEIFTSIKATVKQHAKYPGWEPNVESPILAVAKKVYENTFHKKLLVKAIHAGLECGLLGSKYPHLDMISLGPTIRRAHSPDEKVEIASVAKFWQFVIALLKQTPKKY